MALAPGAAHDRPGPGVGRPPSRDAGTSAARPPSGAPASERPGDEDFETVLAGKPQRKAEGKVKEAAPDAPAEAPAGETQRGACRACGARASRGVAGRRLRCVAPAVPAAVVAEGLPDVGVAAVTDAAVQVTPEKPKVAAGDCRAAGGGAGGHRSRVERGGHSQPRVVKVSSDQPVASDAPPAAAVQKIAACVAAGGCRGSRSVQAAKAAKPDAERDVAAPEARTASAAAPAAPGVDRQRLRPPRRPRPVGRRDGAVTDDRSASGRSARVAARAGGWSAAQRQEAAAPLARRRRRRR